MKMMVSLDNGVIELSEKDVEISSDDDSILRSELRKKDAVIFHLLSQNSDLRSQLELIREVVG